MNDKDGFLFFLVKHRTHILILKRLIVYLRWIFSGWSRSNFVYWKSEMVFLKTNSFYLSKWWVNLISVISNTQNFCQYKHPYIPYKIRFHKNSLICSTIQVHFRCLAIRLIQLITSNATCNGPLHATGSLKYETLKNNASY